MECWPFIFFFVCFRPRQIHPHDLDFVVLVHFYVMQGTLTEMQICIMELNK